MVDDVEGLIPDDVPGEVAGAIPGEVPGYLPNDEVPDADAQEQRRPVDADDETGLDTEYLSAGAADREANDADVLEQAFVVAADDDWDEIG